VGGIGLSTRLRIVVRGAVQGVGFRPFIYRLAEGAGLKGWVNNSSEGVFIEVEGSRADLQVFLLRVESEKPPRSSIHSLEASWLDPVGYGAFAIRESEVGGAKRALVLPDIATCPDCLAEIFDPTNRRYGYPFTNCTNCGPRFSIIEALPYDRPKTAMKAFRMCSRCQEEYDDPRDRRFHAQPNACPVCGPHLELWDREGRAVMGAQPSGCSNDRRYGTARKPPGHPAKPELLQPEGCAPLPPDGNRVSDGNGAAIAAAAAAMRQGQIVAVKGLGGFHLMVAAHHEEAVRRLRELKHREEKPFALMFPSVAAVKAACEVSALEERLLRSPETPIVLLRRMDSALRTPHSAFAAWIAPGNPNLGVMLPYTPLHHLLLSTLGFAVVATSGNLSDEPICTDEHEALQRLGGIADLFLVHNRPIVRHVDDSIVRVMMDRELVLRRARGYAPLPVRLNSPSRNSPSAVGRTVLAVGAHLKNAVALSVGPQVFISQHIGDLETEPANNAFRRVIGDLQALYEARPALVAADAHPDYLSTRFAQGLCSAPQSSTLNPQLVTVQHHIAHVLSCMAENELEPPLLGVSWDGTGYGLDGTVWGGEFFLVTETACERVASLRQFRLPGGDQAVKEPRRTALGLLYEQFGEAAFSMSELAPVAAFSPVELGLLKTMLMRKLNSPLTSSVGRLFDAVAALARQRQQLRFEGQAAMELEFALNDAGSLEAYSLPIRSVHAPRTSHQAPMELDWSPMLEAILADVKHQLPVSQISARFHNALADAIVVVAQRVGQPGVVLSGGCFQNRYLTERSVQRLQAAGFRPYWHQRVPPNDGGISLGQVLAALRLQQSASLSPTVAPRADSV
jgi:hydrogenase maturation protein HypF